MRNTKLRQALEHLPVVYFLASEEARGCGGEERYDQDARMVSGQHPAKNWNPHLIPASNWIPLTTAGWVWECVLPLWKLELMMAASAATLTFFFWHVHTVLCIYFWLPWIFIAVCKLPLVVESGGFSLLRGMDFSLWWLLLLWNVGSRGQELQSLRQMGSVAVAHRLSCFAACGIFPDRGSNTCPLHWRADSYPLDQQDFLRDILEAEEPAKSI